MRRTLLLSLALLGLLAACSEPLPERELLTVDGPSSAPATLPPGQSAYYELTVGADPVRVDAWATANKETADLDLVVYNQEWVPIAIADSRLYFHFPSPERARPLGLPPFFTPVWSVNLLADTGRVYLEVKNQYPTASVTIQVQAVSRGGPEPWSCDYPRSLNTDTMGAILFLGQMDCYIYSGTEGKDLTLAYAGPLDLRFKVVHNGGETPLQSGETYTDLQTGDLIMVYTYRDRRVGGEAGFCDTLPGCADGIATGEYLLDLN